MNHYRKYKELCIESDLSKLQEIRDYVINASMRSGFPADIAQNIALAVDEACTNLIKYSFNYNPHNKICIAVVVQSKEFNVFISDDGTSFNPTEVPTPDMLEYFRTMKPGGLGIHIMRSVMDDISYISSSPEHPHNTLKLKKFLA